LSLLLLLLLLLSLVDGGVVLAARSWTPEPTVPDVSKLTVFVTLFGRRFFLRFRSVADAEDADTTAVVVAALGQVVVEDDGAPDDDVGDGHPVASRTVSERSLSVDDVG